MIALDRRVLAVIAGTLGALALLAGRPAPRSPAGFDVARLARAIAREEDHVTALELAAWIRDGKPGLRLVDVRAPADLDRDDADPIPGAERLSLEALVTARFAERETVVLFSEGGAHAAQGWVLLCTAGITGVLFLQGGVDAWHDEVLHPTLASTASPEEIAAFARTAALSRFFGGVPRAGVMAPGRAPPPRAVDVADDAPPPRRRGC